MNTHDLTTSEGVAAYIADCQRQLAADQASDADARRRHEARTAALNAVLAAHIDAALCEPWRRLHADLLRMELREKTPTPTAKNKGFSWRKLRKIFSRRSAET